MQLILARRHAPPARPFNTSRTRLAEQILSDYSQSWNNIFKLKKLLQEADLVKFAKSHPLANEIDLHRRDAENIIEIMHPKVEETERKEEHGS